MPGIPFTQGLFAVSDHCHVWLEPDGGWGYSNSGLVVGRTQSLLIDTLFDPPMTENMVTHMRDLVDRRPITTLFNTHSDGDHWYGNQVMAGIEIIATETSAAEMHHKPPAEVDHLRQLPDETGDFARGVFGAFDWQDVTPTYPTTTFERELTLDVGGVEVDLIRLGPAHTAGDAIAWVPESKTLFAGDLLFNGGTPIAWAGPVEAWVRACDAMEELGAEVVVPGHGPVTDVRGIRLMRDYLQFVIAQANEMFAAGIPASEAARRIQLGGFAELGASERIVQNVHAVYYELDPTMEKVGVLAICDQMAGLHFHGHGRACDRATTASDEGRGS
jgi:glyoxylase-like metal-dependent hydrolase (beta-lactamase superfamily II)